ncbi:MAG: hypothetical protein OXM87_05555, partial [Truepera sp.]|nr:hypothetical protein [Truepera sp.]
MPRRVLSVAALVSLASFLAACGPNRAVQDLEARRVALETQVENLQDDLEDAQGRISTLEDQLGTLALEREEAEERAAAAGARLVELEAESEILVAERDALVEELRVAREVSASVEARVVSEVESQLAESILQKEALLADLVAAKAARQRLLNQASTLRVELARVRASTVGLETSLSEADEALAGAEAEREALQEELVSSSEVAAETLAGVEAERDTLLSRVTTLEGEVAAAATRYAELETSLSEADEALAGAEAEREALQEEL